MLKLRVYSQEHGMNEIHCKRKASLAFGTLAVCLVGIPRLTLAADITPSTSPPPSFAVVVGINRGGPGQTELRFAEDDARHMADLLASLGRYEPGKVVLLLRPTLGEVRRALSDLALRAAETRRQGAESQVLFYYSGHARASALNLGDEEFPLADLRAQLLSMPAAVTIVLLDACQSGAISRIKGAEATADFSYNSINRLNTAGIAVMASSSATELSQESDSLRSSYFTHHLLVGLRGAGDTDHDGRVTLAEAYRYAYNQTLAATAATAVGSQHATLETGLRGKGEVVLTYPAAASSRIDLPSALAGDVLVRLEPAGTVLAEMHKVQGQAIRLALPPGHYVAIVRQESQQESQKDGQHEGQAQHARRCDLTLADGHTEILNATACPDVEPVAVAAKGMSFSPRERWSFHAALGASSVRNDRFIGRLADFGFQDSIYFGLPRFSLDAMRTVGRHLAVGVELASLDERVFRRQSSTTLSGQDERYWWATYALGAFVLVDTLLWRERLNPYARGGVGLTLARTSYRESDPTTNTVRSDATSTDFGYALRAGAGLGFMPWRHFGFFGEANATFAPTVNNLVGDVHDSGGFGLLLGLRGAL
jgi:hypothetical protein